MRFGIGLLWLTPVAVLGPFVLDLIPDGVPVPVEHRLLYLAICAPFLVLSLRTMRIGLFTEPDGVTVRGVLRTHHIPWDQIAGFEWGKWGGFDLPMVRRTDGTCVVIYALNRRSVTTAASTPSSASSTQCSPSDREVKVAVRIALVSQREVPPLVDVVVEADRVERVAQQDAVLERATLRVERMGARVDAVIARTHRDRVVGVASPARRRAGDEAELLA